MNRALSYGIIALFIGVSIVLIAARPEWIGDQNTFLKNFVNHEYLNLLGVILAITLASVASIHLEFNKIEERAGQRFLFKSRDNIRKNAMWLILLFCFGLTVVTVKPLMGPFPTSQGVANAAALLVLLCHILILVSLTELVFAIKPDIPEAPVANPENSSDPTVVPKPRRTKQD